MKSTIIFLVVCILVYMLQVALAPHIAILGVIPNFLMAYTLAVSFTSSYKKSILVSFISGLVFDIISGGVMGISATLYLASCFFVFNKISVNALSPMMKFGVVAPVLCFAINFSYILISLILGVSSAPMLSQLLSVVISSLYSYVLVLFMYLILYRAFKVESADAFTASGSSVSNVGRHSTGITSETIRVKSSNPSRRSINRKKKWL